MTQPTSKLLKFRGPEWFQCNAVIVERLQVTHASFETFAFDFFSLESMWCGAVQHCRKTANSLPQINKIAILQFLVFRSSLGFAIMYCDAKKTNHTRSAALTERNYHFGDESAVDFRNRNL